MLHCEDRDRAAPRLHELTQARAAETPASLFLRVGRKAD
jgi:hypothetical protein